MPRNQLPPQILLFNKPYGVHTQFSGDSPNLSDYIDIPRVYAAGRLDKDSEGLLILTADGALQHRITDPKHKLEKIYWAQVDGDISESALDQLRIGVELKDGLTRPAHAIRIDPPNKLWPRDPPVRFRKNIPTSWIELGLREGRNRQVRRMTAKVGHPTLRLIRTSIGPWTLRDNTLAELQPGKYCWVDVRTT